MNKTAFRQQHCNQTLTPPLKWSNQHWLGKPVPIIVILETQRPKSRIPKPYEKVSIFHWIGKKNHQKNTKKKKQRTNLSRPGKSCSWEIFKTRENLWHKIAEWNRVEECWWYYLQRERERWGCFVCIGNVNGVLHQQVNWEVQFGSWDSEKEVIMYKRFYLRFHFTLFYSVTLHNYTSLAWSWCVCWVDSFGWGICKSTPIKFKWAGLG